MSAPEPAAVAFLAAAEAADAVERKKKVIPKEHADALAAETPVAVGGGRLWIHGGDGYRDGEDELKRRLAERLGDRWRPNHEDAVLRYLAAAAPRLRDEPPLDRVGVTNGILDLGDLENPRLGPHDPAFLSTVRLNAPYDPLATAPLIDKFIVELVGEETRELIYEIVGLSIVPDNTFQKAFMFMGPGGTGKSTLLNLIRRFIGPENVAACSLQKLGDDRFATADLYGKRLNICADLPSADLSQTSTFKEIVGGDTIRAERKFRDPFTFTPHARLLFSANEVPRTPDGSDAWTRRWVTVGFDRTFGPGERDPKLIEKLTTPDELSGLLNRGIEGLARLYDRGEFAETENTRRAFDQFRRSSDSVAGFIETAAELVPKARTPRPAVFKAYEQWCSDSRITAVTRERFYDRLENSYGLTEIGAKRQLAIRLRGEDGGTR